MRYRVEFILTVVDAFEVEADDPRAAMDQVWAKLSDPQELQALKDRTDLTYKNFVIKKDVQEVKE